MSETKHHRIAAKMLDVCKGRGEIQDSGRLLRIAEQTIFLVDNCVEDDHLLSLVALQFSGLLMKSEVNASWYIPPWSQVLNGDAKPISNFINLRSDELLGTQEDGMPIATITPLSMTECFPDGNYSQKYFMELAMILNIGFYQETKGLMAPIWIMPERFFNMVSNVVYPLRPDRTIWEWQRMGVRNIAA